MKIQIAVGHAYHTLPSFELVKEFGTLFKTTNGIISWNSPPDVHDHPKTDRFKNLDQQQMNTYCATFVAKKSLFYTVLYNYLGITLDQVKAERPNVFYWLVNNVRHPSSTDLNLEPNNYNHNVDLYEKGSLPHPKPDPDRYPAIEISLPDGTYLDPGIEDNVFNSMKRADQVDSSGLFKWGAPAAGGPGQINSLHVINLEMDPAYDFTEAAAAIPLAHTWAKLKKPADVTTYYTQGDEGTTGTIYPTAQYGEDYTVEMETVIENGPNGNYEVDKPVNPQDIGAPLQYPNYHPLAGASPTISTCLPMRSTEDFAGMAEFIHSTTTVVGDGFGGDPYDDLVPPVVVPIKPVTPAPGGTALDYAGDEKEEAFDPEEEEELYIAANNLFELYELAEESLNVGKLVDYLVQALVPELSWALLKLPLSLTQYHDILAAHQEFCTTETAALFPILGVPSKQYNHDDPADDWDFNKDFGVLTEFADFNGGQGNKDTIGAGWDSGEGGKYSLSNPEYHPGFNYHKSIIQKMVPNPLGGDKMRTIPCWNYDYGMDSLPEHFPSWMKGLTLYPVTHRSYNHAYGAKYISDFGDWNMEHQLATPIPTDFGYYTIGNLDVEELTESPILSEGEIGEINAYTVDMKNSVRKGAHFHPVEVPQFTTMGLEYTNANNSKLDPNNPNPEILEIGASDPSSDLTQTSGYGLGPNGLRSPVHWQAGGYPAYKQMSPYVGPVEEQDEYPYNGLQLTYKTEVLIEESALVDMLLEVGAVVKIEDYVAPIEFVEELTIPEEEKLIVTTLPPPPPIDPEPLVIPTDPEGAAAEPSATHFVYVKEGSTKILNAAIDALGKDHVPTTVGYLRNDDFVRVIKEKVNDYWHQIMRPSVPLGSDYDGPMYIRADHLYPLEHIKPSIMPKVSVELQHMTEMEKLAIPDWTSNIGVPYYNKSTAEYWITVTVPEFCITSDTKLNEIHDLAKKMAVEALFIFYDKEYNEDYVDKFANGFLTTRVEDDYLPPNPKAKLRIWVKVGAQYLNAIPGAAPSPVANTGRSVRLVAPFYEGNLNLVADLMEEKHQEIALSGIKIPSFNMRKESQRLRATIPRIKELIRENGHDVGNPENYAIEIMFDSAFKVVSVGIDHGVGKVALTKGLSKFQTSPPISFAKTMSFLYNHETMVSSRSQPWTQFVSNFTFPAPNIKPSTAPPPFASTGDLNKEMLTKDVIDLIDRFDTNPFKTLAFKVEEDNLITSKQFKNSMSTYRDRIIEDVGEQFFSTKGLRNSIESAYTLDDLFDKFLDRVGVLDVFESAAACLGFDIPDLSNPFGAYGGIPLPWVVYKNVSEAKTPSTKKEENSPVDGFLQMYADDLAHYIHDLYELFYRSFVTAMIDILIDCEDIQPTETKQLDYGAQNIGTLLADSSGNPADTGDNPDSAINGAFAGCGIPVPDKVDPAIPPLFVSDVSNMLTTNEVLALFDGSAKVTTLSEIKIFIDDEYPQLQPYLSDIGMIEDFFECLGDFINPDEIDNIKEEAATVVPSTEDVCFPPTYNDEKILLGEKCDDEELIEKYLNQSVNSKKEKLAAISNFLKEGDIIPDLSFIKAGNDNMLANVSIDSILNPIATSLIRDAASYPKFLETKFKTSNMITTTTPAQQAADRLLYGEVLVADDHYQNINILSSDFYNNESVGAAHADPNNPFQYKEGAPSPPTYVGSMEKGLFPNYETKIANDLQTELCGGGDSGLCRHPRGGEKGLLEDPADAEPGVLKGPGALDGSDDGFWKPTPNLDFVYEVFSGAKISLNLEEDTPVEIKNPPSVSARMHYSLTSYIPLINNPDITGQDNFTSTPIKDAYKLNLYTLGGSSPDLFTPGPLFSDGSYLNADSSAFSFQIENQVELEVLEYISDFDFTAAGTTLPWQSQILYNLFKKEYSEFEGTFTTDGAPDVSEIKDYMATHLFSNICVDIVNQVARTSAKSELFTKAGLDLIDLAGLSKEALECNLEGGQELGLVDFENIRQIIQKSFNANSQVGFDPGSPDQGPFKKAAADGLAIAVIQLYISEILLRSIFILSEFGISYLESPDDALVTILANKIDEDFKRISAGGSLYPQFSSIITNITEKRAQADNLYNPTTNMPITLQDIARGQIYYTGLKILVKENVSQCVSAIRNQMSTFLKNKNLLSILRAWNVGAEDGRNEGAGVWKEYDNLYSMPVALHSLQSDVNSTLVDPQLPEGSTAFEDLGFPDLLNPNNIPPFMDDRFNEGALQTKEVDHNARQDFFSKGGFVIEHYVRLVDKRPEDPNYSEKFANRPLRYRGVVNTTYFNILLKDLKDSVAFINPENTWYPVDGLTDTSELLNHTLSQHFDGVKYGVRLSYAISPTQFGLGAINAPVAGPNVQIGGGMGGPEEVTKLEELFNSLTLANPVHAELKKAYRIKEAVSTDALDPSGGSLTDLTGTPMIKEPVDAYVIPLASFEVDATDQDKSFMDHTFEELGTLAKAGASPEFGQGDYEDILLTTYMHKVFIEQHAAALEAELFNSVEFKTLFKYSFNAPRMAYLTMLYSIMKVSLIDGTNEGTPGPVRDAFDSTKQTIGDMFKAISSGHHVGKQKADAIESYKKSEASTGQMVASAAGGFGAAAGGLALKYALRTPGLVLQYLVDIADPQVRYAKQLKATPKEKLMQVVMTRGLPCNIFPPPPMGLGFGPPITPLGMTFLVVEPLIELLSDNIAALNQRKQNSGATAGQGAFNGAICADDNLLKEEEYNEPDE